MRHLEIFINIFLILMFAAFLGVSASTSVILNNGFLRFGTGSEPSVNSSGNLLQPFYINSSNVWRKLTFSNYPLDFEIAEGGVGTNAWNYEGTKVQNPVLSNLQIVAADEFDGSGVVNVTGTLVVGTATIRISHKYELPASKSYLKVTTKFENLSNRELVNLRYWVGTRDDYVGATDQPLKEKGNLVDGEFVRIANQNSPSKALRISTPQEGILFYTDTDKGDIVVDRCCSFSNVTSKNPRNSDISVTNDGSYAFYVRLNDLAIGASDEFTWYYAAGSLADLETIISDVASAAGAVANVTFNSVEFRANSSIGGTGYYLVLPRNAPAPSDDQIRNPSSYTTANANVEIISQGSQAINANVETIVEIGNLSPGADYTIYFVVVERVNDQDVFSPIAQTNFASRAYGPPAISATSAATSITTTSASTGGMVDDDGSDGTAPVLARGVCWATSVNPDTDATCQEVEPGVGLFSTTLTGLLPATTYYVRAFARNTLGTNYGPQITFSTLNRTVSTRAITQVIAPVLGATPITSFTTTQYNGSVSWSPAHNPFQADISYTATITLTPKAGFTMTGVAANFFNVSGAQSAANALNSGVITATFDATASNQVRFMSERSSYIEPQIVMVGDLVQAPETPIRPGFTFLGWYRESNFATLWNFNTDPMPSNALVLFAKWENRMVDSPTLPVVVENLVSAVDISREIANGDEVSVVLRLQVLENLNVPDQDRSLVTALIQTRTRPAALFFFDISLLKIVNDVEISITEADDVIELEMDIPLELQGNENFRVLRVHNDQAEELDSIYDPQTQTIRFETDKFSTYALAYDTPLRLSAPVDADIPDTDGLRDLSLWFGLVGLLLVWLEKRLRQQKMSV
jgi:uncharacterized repeat protein (TIGR02543 family)